MEEKILAVIKQPVPSNIVRGLFYIIIGIFMIVVLVFIGEDSSDFMDTVEDIPIVLIIPLAGIIFPALGLGNIIIAVMNAGFKEIPIKVVNGKLIVHGHVLSTPIYSGKKLVELDFDKTSAAVKRGNVKSSAFTWWKLYLSDQNKSITIRILKFITGDITNLVNSINNKSA